MITVVHNFFFWLLFFFFYLGRMKLISEILLLREIFSDVSVNVEETFLGMRHPQVDKAHDLAVHLPDSLLAKVP
jgi:hypothetical protein